MEHKTWIDSLVGDDNYQRAAEKIGINGSTLTRQINKRITAENVVALCRAYDRPAVTGLVETGYLQPWEAEGVSLEYALVKASDRQLLAQIENRLSAQADDLFRAADNPNVVQFDRSNTIGSGVGPVIEDQSDEPYVADDDEAEPAEGDDDYGDGA